MKKIMIKNGEFTNRDGETKNRWVQVGVIREGDKGEYILFDPTVNLAGFDREGRTTLIASIFEDNGENKGQNNGQQKKAQVASQEPDFDSDIPF